MNQNVLRETDDAARTLARKLIREAPFAALAVNEPETGFPLASRVLLATDIDGTPVILVSRLSVHTQAMERDPRVSLLTGEPGKGDPLAHPRLTTRCHVSPVIRESDHHERLRQRFLDLHKKAKNYIDFPDFNLLRLEPVSANLNGGFGKAYFLEGTDIVRQNALAAYQWFDLTYAKKHAEVIFEKAKKKEYTLTTIDPEGIYIKKGGATERSEFAKTAENHDDVFTFVRDIVEKIP
ncbi:pyridoxamine 5'-phosphate oxidase family protein [uncultured Martelella sp.]|uniref:HugZ family pyridoxamine 5'-phosphate oxidase n=1 Tax=uncultured Martelella sp. TaxID=392331 RepID=UPI0029C727F1|nr:pyridoxamine 5'-phosphate oxidase family protein [uncultured Martelella sp.]